MNFQQLEQIMQIANANSILASVNMLLIRTTKSAKRYAAWGREITIFSDQTEN